MFNNSTNKITISNEKIRIYQKLSELIDKNLITRHCANVISYVFVRSECSGNPQKFQDLYNKGKGEKERITIDNHELNRCEYDLINSFNNNSINKSALDECKEVHHLFARMA